MRVLSIGNFGHGWDGSICDEEHIAKELEWQGHKVTRWQREDYDVMGFPIKYDFVLLAQWDGYDGMLLGTVKDLHIPIVYWAFDYQADGQEWHTNLVKEADLYLSKRLADWTYPNWQWLAQDFAPSFMGRHDEKPERDIDVLFTGSYLPWATERNETLKAIDDNFNLTICSVNGAEFTSRGFKDVRSPVMDREYTKLVARAKINLSIDHTIEAGYWSDRNAQIMACGGMVLFRYVPLSEATFHDKVAYFYNTQDCLDKIAYYLTRPLERMALGSRGYEYAQKHLMVKNRVKDLVAIVEGIL